MTNINKPPQLVDTDKGDIKEILKEFGKTLNVYEISSGAIDDSNSMLISLISDCSKLLVKLTTLEARVTGETSDGYHTFNELYEFRKLYNAVLFNEWYKQGKYEVHKSKKHNDGELCFGGGWFIVMATTPFGQISNHYELKDWDLFNCPELPVADKWDGHTAQDVVSRLKLLTQGSNNYIDEIIRKRSK